MPVIRIHRRDPTGASAAMLGRSQSAASGSFLRLVWPWASSHLPLSAFSKRGSHRESIRMDLLRGDTLGVGKAASDAKVLEHHACYQYKRDRNYGRLSCQLGRAENNGGDRGHCNDSFPEDNPPRSKCRCRDTK